MATRTLRYGCTGSDVKTLQRNLNKLGFNCGAVDGSFEPKTQAAVKSFQRSAKITVDGIVGPQTRAALAGKLKKKKKSVVKKKTKKKKKTTTSHEIGRWGGHKFVISRDKKNTSQGTVARKGANPTEVSFTIVLNAFTGSGVRDTALKLVDQARSGKTDYFYVGNKKLVSCKLMLTEATVKEPTITQGGKWTSAEVMVTMKQCSKGGSSSGSSSSSSKKSSGSSSRSGSSGGSNKTSVRNTSPTTTKKTSIIQKAANAVKNYVKKATKTANATIKKYVQQAKQATAAKKYGGGGTRYMATK